MVYGSQLVHVNWSILIKVDVHDYIAQLSEFGTTHWLSKKVSDHFICGTIFNCEMSSRYNISNEEISDVHMTCPLAARSTSICLQQLCTQIVLM